MRGAHDTPCRFVCALAACLAAPPPAVPAAENAPRPALLWRHNAGAAVTAQPALQGDRIAFTTRSGTITLMDVHGRLLWSAAVRDDTNGPAVFEAPPAFACGRVIVVSTRGWVSALGTNGATAWQYPCGEDVRAAPLVATEEPAPRLFVLTQPGGIVHCLDAQTGRRIWRSEATNRSDGSPALAAGRILFGNCDAALHAVDAASGRTLTRVALGADCQVAAGVAADGALAYCGTRSGAVCCVDVERGTVVWTNGASKAETFTTPVLCGRLVVIGSFDGSLYAFDRGSGALAWTCPLSGTPGNPVVHGADVIVGAGGKLRAIAAGDGRERWSIAISDEIAAPVVSGDNLLVAGDDGSVSAYCISPEKPAGGRHP